MTILEEKVFLSINESRQGMILTSRDTRNPVLLFLHGGPGSPEVALSGKHPTGLEDLFTVCWWEQRGAGLSYRRGLSKTTMTIDQMIADTIAVTLYLRQRFGQARIYLMGHSWGSLLGTLTVSQAPELFKAYIGVGQIVRQAESERIAYRHMLDVFRANGDKTMVRRLDKHPIDQGAPIDEGYMMLRSAALNKLGIGMTRRPPSMMELPLALMRCRWYSWPDRLRYVQGMIFSNRCLWSDVLAFDLEAQAPSLTIPAYIMHGAYDYQVSYDLSRQYAQALVAPLKGFYTFRHSAHSPCFEEPERMCQILRDDVLRGRTELADPTPDERQ
ncbi:MAG: alpha/beta hydrolase [Propionibacteriaceae bacterium]|jgi:pimeloyl-ACP methyl ester carboxylesterase|nr:alpha/beta hydrolase [Propionibacteriaceae bacterium]